LPVFPETSYSWASQADLETATQQARNAWVGNDFQGAANGENADPIVRLALHNNASTPWRDALFQEFAQRIYVPAIENGGDID
jgi:exonuclease V gamma subunit